MTIALSVRSLSVGYESANGGSRTVVVNGVDLDLRPGEILGLAGESGCGKSTAALSAIGFRIPGAEVLSGSATMDEVDLLTQPISALRKIWGKRISYVAQEAAQALNPLHRVERLLTDPLAMHLGLRGPALRERALRLLEDVGIPEPDVAIRRYPHQFSGGQQQRIALAIALSCQPAVLILDEPTTGLDVTTQAQISELLRTLVRESGTAALSISHDLALLATVCDEIAIMYAGEIVEQSAAKELYSDPRHPYALALLDAVPKVADPTAIVGLPGLPPPSVVEDRCAFAERCRFVADRCQTQHPELIELTPSHSVRCLRATELGRVPSGRVTRITTPSVEHGQRLLEISHLCCAYGSRPRVVAVDDVSLGVAAGETLAVVGESGSGKTTLLRAVAGLHSPEAGVISFENQPLPARAVKRSRSLRQAIQLVFQNPDASLNPRHTVGTILERPLGLFRPDLSRRERRQRILELLADVRLEDSVVDRYPAQLSGGQKAAHRPGTRIRRRAQADPLRRGRVGPRCLSPGIDPRAPRPSRFGEPDGAAVHHSRPCRRPLDRGSR